MQPVEPTYPTLLERLRAELSSEGAVPSRARLSALIEAGAARVAGRLVRDPTAPVAPDERVTFDPEDADSDAISGALARRRRAASGPRALPAGVYFADRQLVVVERSAFPAQDPIAFLAQVAERLGGAGGALLLVPDPTCPGSGPVLLARSAAGVARLSQQVRAGEVRETLLGPPPPGSRTLQPPARAELTLRHPRTNRRLTFRAATPGPDAPPR